MMKSSVRLGLVLALGGVIAGAAPVAASMQQEERVREQESCRCVDRDGNEIENCTCMRAPRISVFPGGFMTGDLTTTGYFQRRAQIGVWIDYDQDAEYDRDGGALLTEVQEDGAAWDAGLREGDVVVAINGVSLLEPLEEGGEGLAVSVSANRPAPLRSGYVPPRKCGPALSSDPRSGRTRTSP